MRTLVRLCCALALLCAVASVFSSTPAGAQRATTRSAAAPAPAPSTTSTLDTIPPPLYAAIQQTRLQASDAAASDEFGISVALSSDGNTALVGAYLDNNSGGADAGSAYVYTRSGTTWTEQTRLQASDAAANDQFGFSVALSSDGNTAIVSSRYDDNSGGGDSGSAYVFTRSGTTWSQQTRLQASDAAGDLFGWSVALSSDGNTALVGSVLDDNSGGTDAGSAYVYTRSGTTWTEQTRLQASDALANDQFGNSVALSSDGNTAIVGSRFDDNSGGFDAGSAYVFTRSGTTWSQQTRLQASDAAAGDFFGWSVALSSDGNTALVGSVTDDNSGGSNAGSAYVYTRSGTTWSQQTRLQASDAAANDQFGFSVDLSSDGNTAIVGAITDANSGGTDAGSAYVYTRSGTTWTEQTRLQASDAAANDQFGWSVALSSDGNTAIVGARWDDNSGGTDAGSAYTFAITPSAAASQVIISEFRFSGPGGTNDEYVELYNNTDSDLDIGGYALYWLDSTGAAASGHFFPANTVIRARGHYLVAGTAYSLTSYAAGNAANGGGTNRGGVGLFKTNTAPNPANRIDSVLFNDAEAAAGQYVPAFKEGTSLPQTGDSATEHAWLRDMSAGRPKDTNNNAADFRLVSTTGASIGGVQSTLGAPGPENAASPIDRTAQFPIYSLDATKSTTASPNRERDTTANVCNGGASPSNCTFGTMTIRHRFTNNTGAPVTRLRFRVAIITGFPVTDPTLADLRVLNSSDTPVSGITDANTCAASGTSQPCTVTVRGLTVETPPAQASGGGLNSSLSVAAVTTAPETFGGDETFAGGLGSFSSGEDSDGATLLGPPVASDTIGLDAPLASGASINVQFLFGVQKTGRFRFYVVVEALP